MNDITDFIKYSVAKKPHKAYSSFANAVTEALAEKLQTIEDEVRDSVYTTESIGTNFHVLAKKGDYTFARDKKRNIGVVFYKDTEIDSGDFDDGADGWFLNHKSFGSQSNAFFDSAKEVVNHFSAKRITKK